MDALTDQSTWKKQKDIAAKSGKHPAAALKKYTARQFYRSPIEMLKDCILAPWNGEFFGGWFWLA